MNATNKNMVSIWVTMLISNKPKIIIIEYVIKGRVVMIPCNTKLPTARTAPIALRLEGPVGQKYKSWADRSYFHGYLMLERDKNDAYSSSTVVASSANFSRPASLVCRK